METCATPSCSRMPAGNRYCRKCHNANMRKWRESHQLTPEQRRKDNARSYAGVYLCRGKLVKPQVCDKCRRTKELEMHHEDYGKPLEVQWLCRPCHRELHKARKVALFPCRHVEHVV